MEYKDRARAAATRADELTREILRRWPDAWEQLDHFRANPPMQWPDWCLLPMAASVAVATRGMRCPGLSGQVPN